MSLRHPGSFVDTDPQLWDELYRINLHHVFLASDLSAFVTGHTIPTDGGTSAAGGWFRTAWRTDREWTNRHIAP